MLYGKSPPKPYKYSETYIARFSGTLRTSLARLQEGQDVDGNAARSTSSHRPFQPREPLNRAAETDIRESMGERRESYGRDEERVAFAAAKLQPNSGGTGKDY